MSYVIEIADKPKKKVVSKESSNEPNKEQNKEQNKESSNEADIATKLNNMMTELTKLKNGVDYQNTTIIRLSGMSDKLNLVETQCNDLAKGFAVTNELIDKTVKRQEKLEKTVIDALKNIIDNNEMGDKLVRSQIKKVLESLTKLLSFKLWKIEISVVSLICLVFLGLAGYISLLVGLLYFFF